MPDKVYNRFRVPAKEEESMNKHHNAHPKGDGPRTKGMDGKPASAPFKEKVGFPGAGLPGKAGPDRSAGTKKAKIHPDSKGL